MPYAVFGDVTALLPYRKITATSKPSEGDITAWIARLEARLKGTFQAASLKAEYTDANAKSIIQDWISFAAAGRVELAFASAGGALTDQSAPFVTAVDKFEKLLEDIHNDRDKYGAILGGGAAPSTALRLRAYVLNNDDDKTISNGDFTPQFTIKDVL